MSTPPNFLVIGAQKSATTSLYRWLRQHPDVYLSPQKELEFFSRTDLYELGFSYYCKRWFSDVGSAIAIGDVSPQYMMSAVAADRIARHLPTARLIAVLRNPIERAHSHYLMMRRRGLEDRSFDAAVDELIEIGVEVWGELDDKNYLAGSLYGRVLDGYRCWFADSRLKVVFYEDLSTDPRAQFAEVLTFLGVDPEFVPRDIGKMYHRGADARRFPRFEAWMMQQIRLKHAIKRIVPAAQLSRLLFWFETELNVRRSPRAVHEGVSKKIRHRLRDFFLSDVDRLRQLIRRDVPWGDFRR